MANFKKWYRTPRGVLKYTHITRPDRRYGGFKTRLVVEDPDQITELIDICRAMVTDLWGVKKFKGAVLPYEKNEDGDFEIRASSEFQPKVHDVTGALIPEDDIPFIYHDTRAKLGLKLVPWGPTKAGYGIKAYLHAVQIITLASGGDFFCDESAEVDQDQAYAVNGNFTNPFGDASGPEDDAGEFETRYQKRRRRLKEAKEAQEEEFNDPLDF